MIANIIYTQNMTSDDDGSGKHTAYKVLVSKTFLAHFALFWLQNKMNIKLKIN